MVVHSGIDIFVNSRKINVQSNRITGAELLKLAGFIRDEHWDIHRLTNETDSSISTIISARDTIEIRDGDRFRVMEGHHSLEWKIARVSLYERLTNLTAEKQTLSKQPTTLLSAWKYDFPVQWLMQKVLMII
jgi:hypothetical protein